jgi:Na+/phosphate symporter
MMSNETIATNEANTMFANFDFAIDWNNIPNHIARDYWMARIHVAADQGRVSMEQTVESLFDVYFNLGFDSGRELGGEMVIQELKKDLKDVSQAKRKTRSMTKGSKKHVARKTKIVRKVKSSKGRK